MPEETARRNYIFSTIKETFKRYGYQAIETPAMENLSTLLGKYGDEGDKLLFRILNSGNFLSKVNREDLAGIETHELSPFIAEKGLRYDLTVPFARFVVQHRSELTFPFKRFQIQPVWRADRPQKGRYREFYQCDADIVGSDSLLNELELIQIIDDVFYFLNLKIQVKINNRKILAGIAEAIDEPDKITDITVAIDKLDKIGSEGVNKELAGKGLTLQKIEQLQPLLNMKGDAREKIQQLNNLFAESETGTKGVEEITELFDHVDNAGIKAEVMLDLTLARGLNYYTGAIIEVKSKEVEIGSICGGGRYDDLTGIFGMPDVSGVGISFGADRIYDVLLKLKRFPEETGESTRVFFVNFGKKEERYCLSLARELRNEGISCEIYPDAGAKMKKQMNYANNNKIPYVAIIGEEEIQSGKIALKNMASGDQNKLSFEDLKSEIKR